MGCLDLLITCLGIRAYPYGQELYVQSIMPLLLYGKLLTVFTIIPGTVHKTSREISFALKLGIVS